MRPHRSRKSIARPAPLACALLVAGSWSLLVAPTHTHADPYSVHAEGAVALAWTDNAANRPELVQVAGESLPEAGFFTQLRPSVLFTYEQRRAVHVSAAALDINLYETAEPSNSYNGTLSYNGLLLLSPVSELGLGAALGFGRVDPLDLAQANQVQGNTTFVSTGVTQDLRRQLSADLRVNQGFAYTFVRTNQPTSVVDPNDPDAPAELVDNFSRAHSVSLTLGGDRTWARTSLGLVANVNYVGVDQNGDNIQLINNLSANVRRDLDPFWSASATLGVGTIHVLEQPPGMEGGDSFGITPTGSLTANYLRPVGAVTANLSATVGYTVTPNLLLGNVTNTANGALSASIPLPWFRRGPETTVTVASTLAMSHSRPSLQASGDPTWNSYTADGVVSWAAQEGLNVALRYQFVRTDVFYGDESMATGDIQPPEDFFRHTILVEFNGRYPARPAAQLPDRSGRRVDLSNEQPIGSDGDQQNEPGQRR
ncbi:hypothetical protein [Haliangium sp.]|uniref:hypothetical protein n=1 Tax=Haliangium sp. TaxID=2663208 RepID=UPI003D0F3695